MQLSAWTAVFTSVGRRSFVRERSPLPLTRLNRPMAASAYPSGEAFDYPHLTRD